MIEARQPIATKHRHFRTARARRLFCETNSDAHLLIDADELKMLNTSGLTWGSPDPKPACTSAGPRPGLAPIRFCETKSPLQGAQPKAPKPTTDAAKKRSHHPIPSCGGFTKRNLDEQDPLIPADENYERPTALPCPRAGGV